MMKRFLALALSAVLALSLTACGSSTPEPTASEAPEASNTTTDSGESYVLKFALQNGENHPLCQGVAKFGEILAEKTDGRITLELYYSGALGDKATTVQGMQTGTIDGAMLMSGFVNNAFQEVSKYYVMDQHEISPNLILFSGITWNKLSAEDQEIIKEAFNESVPYFEELSDAKDEEYLQTIKDSGVEIIDVDVAEWQEACSSVYDTYGEEFTDIINQIKETKY